MLREQGVLVRDSIVARKHYDPEILEGKGLFQLTFPADSSSLKEVKAGARSRDQEAGADAEAMDKHYVLAFSPWFAHPSFFFIFLKPLIYFCGFHIIYLEPM